jgi:hypothetical protein
VAGAPFYVSTWDAFKNEARTATAIDVADINNAGKSGVWSTVKSRTVDVNTAHYDPAAGVYDLNGNVFVVAGQNGRVYKMVDGAPVYVTTWSAFNGGQPYTVVDQRAIDNAGGSGVWRFVAKHIDDGWAIRGSRSGQAFLMAGGASVYVATPSLLGDGQVGITAADVDGSTIGNGDGGAPFDNLLYTPRDGTYLDAYSDATGDSYYRVSTGVPARVDSLPDGVTPALVDQVAVDRAGQAPPWDHLKAPQ